MALSAGTRLGPYEILAQIGAGGMGRVYKARDTRLGRIVAIKVSDEKFSERFEREARAVAALNHPNICQLYDVVISKDAPNYLVMEFIEGAPVAPTENIQALLELGVQIAEGMAAAHALGIVHRDLKPGNILVTREGRVKILDFGLAISSPSSTRPADETLTLALTDPGTTVGTVAYMSPEQARGQAVDTRSDLWSLGVILYEMATRTRPFEGPTAAVMFEGILTKAPAPVRERNPKIPVELERIVARLLEKDRETRYQSAADVRADLKRVERDSSATGVVAPALRPRHLSSLSTNRHAIAAAAVAVVLIAGGIFWWQRSRPKPLTDKDVLVLADFTNTTGEPVFDGTLREALAIQLERSPFLRVMSDTQTQQGLRLTGRSAGERVTNEIARDICVREGEKATIGGSIASLGKTYAIALEATNCQSGDTLAREQVQAEDKEHVLKAIATAATDVRAKLGESLSSIQQEKRPVVDQVTTTSLEAFQVFAQGMNQFRQGAYLAAIPLLQRATELDPNFAIAWQNLGVANGNAGNAAAASVAPIKRAFALVDRVSERERLSITYFYEVSSGQRDKAIDTARLWARTYPREPLPHLLLGQQLNNLGEWQEGLREIQEAYGLEPNNERYTVGLMASYANLDRLDEAKAVGENAVSQKLDAGEIHRGLLYFAYLQGDRAAVEKEIQWFQGKPEEYRSLQTQAANAAVLGHRRQAEALRQQAAEAARRQNLPDAAAGLLASSLLDDALMEDCAAARGQTGGSPLIQALCGNPAAAQKLAHDPSAAPAGAPTVYLQAYLQAVAGSSQRNAPDAGAGFQKILEHKGAYWGPFYAPSYVGLARAALLAGDTAKAKKAYQDFLALWKDADPDIPILIAAKKEYAALP